MFFLVYLFGVISQQNVNQMVAAKPLARAQNRRQRLAHRFGPVKNLSGLVAEIAFATSHIRFAKVTQEFRAAALQSFSQSQQGV